MNIQHLRYAVEVERTGSITKAAENLYMGQPNLSRTIKELEEGIGTSIFLRTSKGIVPTQEGEEFLQQAKEILLKINAMEEKYKTDKEGSVSFSISVPRASYISYAFTKFVKSLPLDKVIEINYRETNSMRAIDNIMQNNYNLGIIRFQTKYETYYANLLREKNMGYESIWNFNFMVLMCTSHPLANKEAITYSDLRKYVEIAHGDPYIPSLPISEAKKIEVCDKNEKKIYVYERGSQFDLLNELDTTYMWVSSIPESILNRNNLIQKKCVDSDIRYKDVLIYRHNYRLKDVDKRFLEELNKVIEATK